MGMASVAEAPTSVAHKSGQLQPRLVKPMSEKLRRGRGDVLVVLSRGLAGKSVRFVKIANNLGLFSWGDQVLGWASDKPWLGQMDVIAHLVTITRLGEILVLDEHSVPRSVRPPTREELLVSKWSGAYDVRGTSGYFQRLMNDEYVHTELQSNGRRSVMWSTEQSLDTFLKVISKMLPQPSRDEEAHLLTADDEREASTADLLVKGTGRELSVHLLRAQFPGTTVVWRRPFRKLAESRRRHAEIGFLYDSDHGIDQDQVRAALSATGSPVVRQVAKTQPTLLDDVLNSHRSK
jgi:hypothetical protein